MLPGVRAKTQMITGKKYTPLNCSKCGRFVGPDGFKDVFTSEGMIEIGYPLCAKCLKNRTHK